MAEQVCRRFSLAEMQSATGDFSDARVIGRGGFGKVYKGLLDDDTLIVAVKRLASNSNQGEQEFAMEMETLSKLRHRNLVSLIGYCNEEGEMILVYEYMPNGTLADHLHKNNRNLTWNQRLRICIGAARALDYLHTGSSVIHRDVKPANILLNENFTAKVSDFGLAKNLSSDDLESHVTVSLKGSFGYIDPSYFISGRLTKASDTYAFGVVLLEVLSGRQAVDGKLGEGELCLTMWAQERIKKGKFHDIVDSTLRPEISGDCLKTFVGVVKRCLYYEPKKRLSMTEAVVQLEFTLEQQDRKGSTRKLQFPPLNPFGNRVKPSVAKLNVRESFGDLAIQLEEMKKITENFSSYNWISNGITGGSIFRGVLKTGKVVAIKRRYKKLPDQEFLEQVTLSSSLKHENVMELLGYCVDDGRQMLVYEFSERGSLHDIFHDKAPWSYPRIQVQYYLGRNELKLQLGLQKVYSTFTKTHCFMVTSNPAMFYSSTMKLLRYVILMCQLNAPVREVVIGQRVLTGIVVIIPQSMFFRIPIINISVSLKKRILMVEIDRLALVRKVTFTILVYFSLNY